MNNKIKKLMIFFKCICLLITNNVQVLAAGKTIGAYKNTTYTVDKGSDAKTIYDGVIKEDSNYSGIYKDVKNKKMTESDFYDKTKTIKYWSSHGSVTGQLFGDSNNSCSFNIFSKDNFTWAGGNLEFVFLAACNQLNKESKNPLKKYAKAMLGNKAVRVICGYHDKAPAIADNKVANKFLDFAKTGESVKSSWIKANEYVYAHNGYTNAKNYAVLTHTGNVQYSRFPGFSGNTYARPKLDSKKILRFRKNVENGETVINTASVKLRKKIVKEKDIKPIKLQISPKCDDFIMNNGNKISIDGGEITEKEIAIGKMDLYKQIARYVKQNILNSEDIDLEMKNMKIESIVADDALSEIKDDKIVSYVVSFAHIEEGYGFLNDKATFIIDSDGIKYITINWSKLK